MKTESLPEINPQWGLFFTYAANNQTYSVLLTSLAGFVVGLSLFVAAGRVWAVRIIGGFIIIRLYTDAILFRIFPGDSHAIGEALSVQRWLLSGRNSLL